MHVWLGRGLMPLTRCLHSCALQPLDCQPRLTGRTSGAPPALCPHNTPCSFDAEPLSLSPPHPLNPSPPCPLVPLIQPPQSHKPLNPSSPHLPPHPPTRMHSFSISPGQRPWGCIVMGITVTPAGLTPFTSHPLNLFPPHPVTPASYPSPARPCIPSTPLTPSHPSLLTKINA